jgi:uncharacterized membrane protein YbhN (UPF0104 family)
VPDDGAHLAGRISQIVTNKRFVTLVGILILFALLYYAFFVVLPATIDWDEVWAALTALTASELVALGLAGVLVMVLLGWAAKASLPGLRLYQGFESSATGQMTAFAIPPPGDYVIRFSMYRTYGFTDGQSATSVLIAMILRYVATFLMPIIGLTAVLLAGQGTTDTRWWFLGYTTAFVAIVYLLRRVIISDTTAHMVGRWSRSLVTWAMGLVHRSPSADIEQVVVDFGDKTRGTARSNRGPLLFSNLAWGLSNALVLGMSMRFSGLDSAEISTAEVLLSNGIVMVLNVLPIPGLNALIVPQLSSILGLTTVEQQSQLTAALTLYRVDTWILPMAIGAVMFFVWRFRVRRDTVTTVNTDSEDDGGWDSGTPSGDPTAPAGSAGGRPAVPGDAQRHEDGQQDQAPED